MTRITLYGDFNCPWSYLASRRAELLAEDGVDVDWAAVEHAPWRPRPFSDSSVRFAEVREELDTLHAMLLPGEDLPSSLAGFVPFTKAAVSAYAEAHSAGVAAVVRPALFEAFWLHGVDLGDARLVRTLLVDKVSAWCSSSELVARWGYAVDGGGGPVTMSGWRLVRDWRTRWQAMAGGTVPALSGDHATPMVGVAAVRWLGEELQRRGLDPGATPRQPPQPPRRDVEPLSWVSQHGNRWMRDYQWSHRRPLYPTAR